MTFAAPQKGGHKSLFKASSPSRQDSSTSQSKVAVQSSPSPRASAPLPDKDEKARSTHVPATQLLLKSNSFTREVRAHAMVTLYASLF